MNYKIIIFLTLQIYYVQAIIHGYKSSIGQFPHQVSLRNYNDKEHFCGGTIIHRKFILTAAHCVYKIHHHDIYIIAGTTKLSETGEKFIPEKIYRGKYDTTYLSNDIALIKVHGNITYSKYIQPLKLNHKNIPLNSTVTICGWGRLRVTNNIGISHPDTLRYEQVTTISLDTCRQMFSDIDNTVLTEKNICTFSSGKGVCIGDSGGPLIYNGRLVGLISHGIPCSNGYPDVYINVASYYRHIIKIIKSL